MNSITKRLREQLPDVQHSSDKRGIAIDSVGVSNVFLPITILQKDGVLQQLHAVGRYSVSLSKHVKGTHMSRFIEQANEWLKSKPLEFDATEFLQGLVWSLHSTSAELELSFDYFVEKTAPISRLKAPMAFKCVFAAAFQNEPLESDSTANDHSKIKSEATLGITVPISTLCPCSKAIAKHGAHNQRAEIRARMTLKSGKVYIEDIVEILEQCGSFPVFPLLKREDEKFVTEQQYENPKFVEDVIRDAAIALRKVPQISSFAIEVEALESIHGHNAWAAHSEG